MDLALPDLAVDLGAVARRAMVDAGAFDLARRSIEQPELRRTVAGALVEQLGIGDLDVRSGPDPLLAGAEVCRVAGALAFPYPLPAMLARPASPPVRFVAAVDGDRAWAEHGDLPGPWLALDPTGQASWAAPVPTKRNRTLGPFVEHLLLGDRVIGPGRLELVLVIALDCCRILGALEAAQRMAVGHVRERHQFGRSLAEFQGVQFHVADSVVVLGGLRQLTRHTMWRVAAHGASALVDALALRSFALEAAQTVLWTSQLLHGAVGFCDEHDLSVVTRTVQASLRLPTDLARTNELLTAAIERDGFDGLWEAAGPSTGAGPSTTTGEAG